MLVPFAYMARKRFKGAGGAKSLNRWLEIHLFCGVVGPVLVTLHTTFKFNGIISAAKSGGMLTASREARM